MYALCSEGWDFAVVSAFLSLRAFQPRLIVFEAHIAYLRADYEAKTFGPTFKQLQEIRRVFDSWNYVIEPVQNNWFAYSRKDAELWSN